VQRGWPGVAHPLRPLGVLDAQTEPLVASIAVVLALGVVQHAADTTLIRVNINDLENAI
jgi:hypothetical protein